MRNLIVAGGFPIGEGAQGRSVGVGIRAPVLFLSTHGVVEVADPLDEG